MSILIHARSDKSFRRLLTAGIPAAFVTVLLFLAMRSLIQSEYTFPPAEKPRVLDVFVMAPVEEAKPRPEHVQKLPETVLPPELPPLRSPVAEVDATGFGYEGVLPPLPPVVNASMLGMQEMPVMPRDITPLRPPVPTYPVKAITNGIEGTCDVRLSVSSQGKPYNIAATCSHRVFQKPAERAMGKTNFMPQIRAGRAVEVHNVVYPLEFKLEE